MGKTQMAQGGVKVPSIPTCKECGSQLLEEVECYCSSLSVKDMEWLENHAEAYRGFNPTVDPAECLQRGLIETSVKERPFTISNILKACSGWKTRLSGRIARQFGPVGTLRWEGTTPKDGGRVGGAGELDLSSMICATDPIGNYGGEREAIAELVACLSDKGKDRLARMIDNDRGLGSYSKQLLELEVKNVLPIWMERMKEVRAEWRIKSRPRYAAAARHLDADRWLWNDTVK